MIHQKVQELIGLFTPQDFAIEAPFFGKNVQSMLKLGRAQGVAIATAMQAGIPVTEYSPKKVKQSITGNGNSEKQQVWKMLQHILQLEEQAIDRYDASDALAVAVCHHFQHQTAGRIPAAMSKKASVSGRRNKPGSWEEFIRQNPGKVTCNMINYTLFRAFVLSGALILVSLSTYPQMKSPTRYKDEVFPDFSVGKNLSYSPHGKKSAHRFDWYEPIGDTGASRTSTHYLDAWRRLPARIEEYGKCAIMVQLLFQTGICLCRHRLSAW